MKAIILISTLMFSAVSFSQDGIEDFFNDNITMWYGGLLDYEIPSRKLSQPYGGWSLPSGNYEKVFTYMNVKSQMDTAYILSVRFDRSAGTAMDSFIEEANEVLSNIGDTFTITKEDIIDHVDKRENLVYLNKKHEEYDLIGVVIDGKDLVLEIHRAPSLR